MAKQHRPNTSTKQSSRLNNRRVGIAAAVLALCFLMIGPFSMRDQAPSQEKVAPQVEEIEHSSEGLSNPSRPGEDSFSKEGDNAVSGRDTSVNNPSATSISWTNMALEIEANQGVLNWETSAENNTSYFEIERSIDQEEFILIGKVEGSGEGSFFNQRYSFIDPELYQLGFPRIYYRIKQIGLDKKVNHSQVYEHDFDLNLGLYIKVDKIENGILTLAYVADEACQALFQVLTKKGKILYEENIDVGFHARRRKLDASIWGEGDYLLVLSNDDTRVSEWLQIRNEEEEKLED